MAEDRRRFREIRKRVQEEFSVATDIDNINYFLYFGLEDSQPRPQGFSLKKMGGAGKGPGIGWSRVPSYTLKSWV